MPNSKKKRHASSSNKLPTMTTMHQPLKDVAIRACELELYVAARDGKIGTVQWLLALPMAKAKPKALSNSRKSDRYDAALNLKPSPFARATASMKLLNAVIQGDYIRFLEALSDGANIYAQASRLREENSESITHPPETVLMIVVKYGRIEMLEYLRQLGINVVEANRQNALLVLAAKHEHVEMLEYLLQFDVDVDVVDANGQNALFFAIEQSSVAMTQMLLQRGASARTRYSLGHTPLHLTAKLKSADAKPLAELLLARGAELNAMTMRNSITPCMLAVLANNPGMVGFFMDKGADLGIGDSDGYTILHLAITTRAFDLCIGMLEQDKTLVDIPDKDGITPLMMAVDIGAETLVDAFLCYGVKTDAVDRDGRTALMHAVEWGQLTLVKKLAPHKGRDTFYHAGMNPIMMAITLNQTEMVEALLVAKVDTDVRTPEGYTLLELAQHLRYTAIISLLSPMIAVTSCSSALYCHSNTQENDGPVIAPALDSHSNTEGDKGPQIHECCSF